MGLLDVVEFRWGLLRALLRAVPAKWASLNEMTPDRVVAAIAEPHIDQEWFDRFDELGHENPLYQRHVRTGDGRAYRFSDVTTREELEATQLFREVYRPLGVNHQIAFTLPSGADYVVAVALSREDRDFSDHERDFLDRARPYLIQAYLNAIAYSEQGAGSTARLESALLEAGLTSRQAQVVRLVALGRSNQGVADELGLSDRTVQKHLEHAFRRLGVRTRSAAATRAWELARD